MVQTSCLNLDDTEGDANEREHLQKLNAIFEHALLKRILQLDGASSSSSTITNTQAIISNLIQVVNEAETRDED